MEKRMFLDFGKLSLQKFFEQFKKKRLTKPFESDIIIKLSDTGNTTGLKKTSEKGLTNKRNCGIIIESLFGATVTKKSFFEKS